MGVFSTKTVMKIELDFTEKLHQRFDRMQDLSESSDKAEVIRKALACYEKVLECEQEGGEVRLFPNRRLGGTWTKLEVV